MGEYITDELIINEYLNNLFNYEDLADYLCIDVSNVNRVLDSIEDEKLKAKLRRHSHIISLYYDEIKNGNLKSIESDNYEETYATKIGLYIVKNHCSIRKCAKEFGLGKTTIFDYIHERLPYVDIILYKKVFDVLMENKSFTTDNKKVREQVLSSYDILLEGHTIKEISEQLNLGWNVVERNLNRRLKQIDQEKYEKAKMILEYNQKEHLKDYEYEPKSK